MKKILVRTEKTFKIIKKFIVFLYFLGGLLGIISFEFNNFLNGDLIILGYSFLILLIAYLMRIADLDDDNTIINTSLKFSGKDYPISTIILMFWQIILSLVYNDFKLFKTPYIIIFCVSPTIIIILQIYFSRQIRIEKMLKELTAKQNSERSVSRDDKNNA